MISDRTFPGIPLDFAEFECCRDLLIKLRWPDGAVRCPACGSEKITWLANPRVWKCYAGHPKSRFSLKTGTIFESSPVALEKWLTAVWIFLDRSAGVSSRELHRVLGVSQKTAWFMLHRIGLAMQSKTYNKLRRQRGGGAVAPMPALPPFRKFSEVMTRLLAVPKSELDEMVKSARENSPRRGDPLAPGRKPGARR